MRERQNRLILGIVGGMGPLASAEFLKTIYECNLGEREQDSPIVMVYSDPSFPDRTEAFSSDAEGEVLDKLVGALNRLSQLGASSMVIACITAHYLLPKLPLGLSNQITSLLDVIFAEVTRVRGRHLLICSNGTRRLELFQRHSQWLSAERFFILPDEVDQNRIHYDLIYRVKRNYDIRESAFLLEDLLAKYQVDSFIAGCTEIHLLAKHMLLFGENRRDYKCIDPLTILAKNWQRN
jgi:aspartate racemase